MIRLLALTCTLAAAPAAAGEAITCETQGDRRHCWNERGKTVSTEERSGDYVHGWDSQGREWTEWRQGDRTYRWPTR